MEAVGTGAHSAALRCRAGRFRCTFRDMSGQVVRDRAPGAFLFGSVFCGAVFIIDSDQAWARLLAAAMFWIGAVWMTSRTIRLISTRRTATALARRAGVADAPTATN